MAQVAIPQSYQPKTNFGEAKFTVGVSSDPTAITNCLKADAGNAATSSESMINQQTFRKFVTSDAGAGNLYETTSYRILHDHKCYAIESTIHSTNIYNYSPDQGIKAYNKEKISGLLEAMAKSFIFLK